LDAASDYPPSELRQFIEVKIISENIIGHSYKHVDGTSFAAPIVSSIVAQMLEANPMLTPQQIKRILMDTAERIPDVPIDQQGWGVVIPARAVEQALQLRDQ
jgi:serine protease AprX